MGIMSDEKPCPLINDEELDGFWDRWGWTNQLYFIACENEDDDRIVRANDASEAVKLFRGDGYQHHNGRKISYVYQIPTQPGLTGVLDWRQRDLPDVTWEEPNPFTSRGKRT